MPGWEPWGRGVHGEQRGGKEEGVALPAGCLWGRGSRGAGERLWGFFGASLRCDAHGLERGGVAAEGEGQGEQAVGCTGCGVQGDERGAGGSRAVSLPEGADEGCGGFPSGGCLWGRRGAGSGVLCRGMPGAGGGSREPTALTHFAGSRPWCRTCHGSTRVVAGRSWPGRRRSPGGHCWPTRSGRCRRCQGG